MLTAILLLGLYNLAGKWTVAERRRLQQRFDCTLQLCFMKSTLKITVFFKEILLDQPRSVPESGCVL